MYTKSTAILHTRVTLPAWLSAMLDHHIANLCEHPHYQRVWWSARQNRSGTFVSIHVTAPPGTLTATDQGAINRLHMDGTARHPELICKGRAWCTDGSDMAVTWQYCADASERHDQQGYPDVRSGINYSWSGGSRV